MNIKKKCAKLMFEIAFETSAEDLSVAWFSLKTSQNFERLGSELIFILHKKK
jgi:hypothetical protein